jgi:hypothetical protein
MTSVTAAKKKCNTFLTTIGEGRTIVLFPKKQTIFAQGVPEYYQSNSRKWWSDVDICGLKELARSDTPTGAIALKLGRSKTAVYAKASKLGISLEVIARKKPVKNRLDVNRPSH